jgi:hypothetical protein
MDIEFNNAAALDTNETGWIIGFSDWTKSKLHGVADLRFMSAETRSHSICMKWMFHRKGDDRGVAKPPSAGRTISIIVSQHGRFRIQFSEHGGFPAGQVAEYVLEKHGQFVVWGENIHHRWFVDEDCTILTLRWIPDQNANV